MKTEEVRQEWPVRTALVGCGNVSSDHVAAVRLLDGVRICAVVDVDERRRRDTAALAGNVAAYPDLASMLEQEQPHAVHVLTPPTTHEELSVEAMEAGCHVLVEKPIALEVAAVDRMMAVAEERKRVLSTCHNMLFKPSVLEARRLVDSGAVGTVVDVVGFYGVSEDSGYRDAPGSHWAYRLPGGVFTNFLPHMISLQQLFMGPTATVAGVVVHADPEDERKQSQLVVLSKGTQASGVMTISILAKPDTKFVEVYGTEGTLRVDLVRELCVLQQKPRLPRAVSKVFLNVDHARQLLTGTTRSALLVATGRLRGNPGLPMLVSEFYAGLGSGRSSAPTAEDGRSMVETLERIWSEAPELTRPRVRATRGERPRTDIERRIVSERSLEGRALVTGATGFLGSHLVAALSRCGSEVVALVRDRTRTPFDVENQAHLVVGSMDAPARLDEAMKGVDVVYHCAAATTSGATWDIHHRDTILGTERVLEAAYRGGKPRVVHVSSVVVYGLRSRLEEPVHESFPLDDDSDRWAYYQRAKIGAEERAFHYSQALGLPVVVLRPGILYGPGRPIRAGLMQLGPFLVSVGRGRNRLPFTYVDNAVDCLLLAGSCPEAPGEAFNVVDEPQVSLRTVLADSGARTVLVPLPPRLLHTVGSVLEGRRSTSASPPRLSHFNVRSACRDITYSTSKAREVLGWQQGVSLQEGLRRAGRR